MTATYNCIATTSLTTTTTTVTFSSISGSYTDLVLVVNGADVNAVAFIGIRFNSDSGSNYSSVRIYAYNDNTDSSDSYSDRTSMPIGTVSNSRNSLSLFNIMNYSGTNNYKSVLSRDNTTGLRTGQILGLWRSTSAITSIDLIAPDSSGFTANSTFSLYGIKAE